VSIQYGFKSRAIFPPAFDREAGAQRLASLLEREGDLSIESILRDARRKESPLRSAFTWDAGDALSKVQEQEADYLRRQFVVVTIERDEVREMRAVVPVIVHDDPDGPRRYIPTMDALSDEAYREQVLRQALKELQALRRKYAELQELAAIFRAIDRASKRAA
jgi:hypothetical protein